MKFDDRVKFLEGILAAPCPNNKVRQKMLTDALRLLSDVTEEGFVFRYTVAGSQAAYAHVKNYHDENPRKQCSTSCENGALERAHPVSVAKLAQDLAETKTTAENALRNLGHAVLLTKEEHKRVGDFGSLERLEGLLKERLVKWESTTVF